MGDLVRFGVAMERGLLNDFDERIASRGYENRSEALRDLVREDLHRAALDGDAPVLATVAAFCRDDVGGDPGQKEYSPEAPVEMRRVALPHVAGVTVLQGTFLPVGRSALELFTVVGSPASITQLVSRLSAQRHVTTCELTVISTAPDDLQNGSFA